MTTRIDIEDVLACNPNVDRQELKRIQELLRRLQEAGVVRKGYDLAPPLGGRRATVQDDPLSDSRLVRLSRGPRT